MLPITIPKSNELWDKEKKNFLPPLPEIHLQLEHSLISISKWEEIYEKPFLGDGSEKYTNKTPEEIMTYIKCMTITPNVSEDVYLRLTENNINAIMDYIGSSRTATTVTHWKKDNKKPEIITSERLYASMVSLRIPVKFEKWFLNRLITLIEVCAADQNPEKMSRADAIAQQRALNAARRAKSKAKKH